MLYEVITMFEADGVDTIVEKAYGGPNLEELRQRWLADIDAILVITSYSIHYTKLYETSFMRMPETPGMARPTALMTSDSWSAPAPGSM